MGRRRVDVLVLGVLCLLCVLALGAGCSRGAKQSSAAPTQQAVVATTTPRATPTATATATPSPTPSPTPTATPQPTPTPVPYRSPLSGEVIPAPAPRPIAVQIDNAPDARPQTGLVDADLVYETPTEASLTRFTAFFQTKTPPVVGPVRSARLIDLQVIPEHDAMLAYSGASNGVSDRLAGSGINLLQVEGNAAAAGWRDSSRYAPYNLYTSIEKLRQAADQFGWSRATTAQSFEFGAVPVPGEASSGVSIPYAAGAVDFRYNSATQHYDRFQAGLPHNDGGTGRPITPRNVITLFTTFTQTGIVEDVLGEYSLDVQLQGSGDAWIFRDGRRYLAKWERQGPNATLRFTDAATGQAIPLAEGQTWICLVPQWLTATPNP